jgi:hypothetical protein
MIQNILIRRKRVTPTWLLSVDILGVCGLSVNMRNWIDSTQDRHYWRVLVNMALDIWIP